MAGTRFGLDFDPVADTLRVVSDTGLTERQKQSLLDVYASFLALNAADPEGPAPAAAAQEDAPTNTETESDPVANEG